MNERLKVIRKESGLTQKGFAERLGVDRTLIVKWENGERSIPTPQMKLICSEFNVRLEWLRDGEGEREQPAMTYGEALTEAICALYDKLPPRKQQVVLEVVHHYNETGKWEAFW